MIRDAYCVLCGAKKLLNTKHETRNTYHVSDENIVTIRILKYLVIVQNRICTFSTLNL